jgi:hypothetical protein
MLRITPFNKFDFRLCNLSFQDGENGNVSTGDVTR